MKILSAAYTKSPNKRRLTRCIKLLDTILADHCKVLVCRIDLIAKGLAGHHMMAKLVRAAKIKFKKDFYGYIYSCEYGVEIGKHYHVVFFLNGSKKRDAFSNMKIVQDIWMDISEMSSSIPRHNPKLGKIKTTGVLRRSSSKTLFNDVTYPGVIYGLSYLCKNSQKIEGMRDFSLTQISRLKNRKKKRHTRCVATKLN